MKTFITSDLHFGHANIIKFCPKTRGHFRDVTHMNDSMRQEWNELIQPHDLVYILGDVAFMPAAAAAKYVSSLNGRKILIEGNHDRKALRDPAFRKCFEEIHVYHEMYWNNTKVCMFHYPIMEWANMHHGSVHLHGHTHQNLSGLEEYRVRNAGYDATGKIAVLMDDMVNDALTGKIKTHH